MNSRDYLIELRKSTGMNRKEFCEYFEIPYRTMTDWELGNRTMPDYLLRLMAYKVEMEKLGIIDANEVDGVKSVLGAAAFTYVASLVSSLLNLLRLVIMLSGRDNDWFISFSMVWFCSLGSDLYATTKFRKS